MKIVLIKIIKIYQRYISLFIAPCCRFHPTCSQYTIEALIEHGVIKGLYLGACRLLRCQPFHQGGVDLVPQKVKEL